MNDIKKELPLYPRLAKGGAEEAEELIEAFKIKLKDAAKEAIGKLYTDLIPYIESDAWTNFRTELMAGLRNYSNRKVQSPFDFKHIRESIYREFREEIIEDLNQDMVEEIKELNETITSIQRFR